MYHDRKECIETEIVEPHVKSHDHNVKKLVSAPSVLKMQALLAAFVHEISSILKQKQVASWTLKDQLLPYQ